jgi:cytochrome c-type biogenesis protein CcmH/NrfF
MSALTTVLGAFVLALVVASLMWGGAGLVIALPVALIVLGVAVALNFNKRRQSAATIHEQRERARTQKVDFTERDEQTLVSE